MTATANRPPLVLGAPGIYRRNAEQLRMLTDVRMDVCAFAGVAPRGPARQLVPDPRLFLASVAGLPVRRSVPFAVESWQAYLRHYGGFEGPGLLPYAVSAFFSNGGRRAWILRIVHRYLGPGGSPDPARDGAGTARAPFVDLACANGAAVWVAARNEGSWGRGLTATLTPGARPLSVAGADILPGRLRLPPGPAIPVGALLRFTFAGGARLLRQVTTLADEWEGGAGARATWAGFDAPTPAGAQSVELVEARLEVEDGAGRAESLGGIGLTAAHPRWLARVLLEESTLLAPCDDPGRPAGDPLAAWLGHDLQLDSDLRPRRSGPFLGGADRYADLEPDDFFDPAWVPGNDPSAHGVHALAELDDLSLLVVPDLYSPGPLVASEPVVDPVGFAGAAFADCVTPPPVPVQAPPPEDLTGLRRDPGTDLEDIIGLQSRLTVFADQLHSLEVLLDVPPGLSQRRILTWRGRFDCAYAAAYHPWPVMAPHEDARGALVAVPPSAFAAGIIAQREHQFGVAHGPANALAVGAVAVRERVAPARHDELHQEAINVFLQERAGVRLSAARTLARDAAWRQLNVRRLVVMIRRALERQMGWVVFEPNDRSLRALLTRLLETYLRRLYRASAFAGATEAEAFFVRCDDSLNPPAYTGTGRLLAQVGVAPAEPMEFIVLDIARTADAVVSMEA